MQIRRLTRNNRASIIKLASRLLEGNGLVVFPSDTVYGLAVNAKSTTAVAKLFQFKERPVSKSVSIAVKDLSDAKEYVKITASQTALLETLLPGPYTIVLPGKKGGVSQLMAEDKTLGIRIPDFWFTKELSAALSFPYTATSANLHSRKPHHSIEALLNTLSPKKQALIDLIIDYGTLPLNLPSTVINLAQETPKTLRQGEGQFKLLHKYHSSSAEETRILARKLASDYRSALCSTPIVFLLQGEMGSGKTVFSQGIGSAFGIGKIVSPTFVVYYEYRNKENPAFRLHHFDLYRLENETDLEVFQIPQLLKPNNLFVFEWGTRLGSFIPSLKQTTAKIILLKLSDLGNFNRQLEVYEL